LKHMKNYNKPIIQVVFIVDTINLAWSSRDKHRKM